MIHTPHPIDWIVESQSVGYDRAVAAMEHRVKAIRDGTGHEMVWLLEHPPLYTAGTSAQDKDLLDAKFPVFSTGRGGQYTYHGPGQRVCYVMLDLQNRGADLRKYIQDLERWIIAALRKLGVTGQTHEGRVGIWVGDDKIAAIGVRVRKWVTFHGISINVNPDLSHFAGIVPCGLENYGTTSLERLKVGATMHDLDLALRSSWDDIFGG